jgi:hypothetical protein
MSGLAQKILKQKEEINILDIDAPIHSSRTLTHLFIR